MGLRWWNWGLLCFVLYVVFRMLRRMGFRKGKALSSLDHIQLSLPSVPPTQLWVVVNGLLGTTNSGIHICHSLSRAAQDQDLSIVAMRIQAGEALFGSNVYSSGLRGASNRVVETVQLQLAKYSSIQSVHFVGNSFGCLV
jgi:hypothetical protein